MKTNYNIQIGSWTVDQGADPLTELNELRISSAAKGIDAAQVCLYSAPHAAGGLLDQAVGAATAAVAGAAGLGGEGESSFSTTIRGNEIKDGDAVSITLTAGDLSDVVFTGETIHSETSLRRTSIYAATGAWRLAATRINQVFENQSADQLISDLADQAGANVGRINASTSYPYYVVDETRSVLNHIQALAMREGMECYVNADNELVVEKFAKTTADHELHYGVHLVDLEMFAAVPRIAHTRVYTESPSSTQGQDTWHWLAKDSSGFQSAAGSGSQLLAISDGAVRTKDAADQLAAGKYGAAKDISTRGRAKLLGNPGIRLADAIEFKGVPKPELNGLFKVIGVEHRFSKSEGYVTVVEFSGLGGADAASGLLGGLAAAVGF